MIIRSVFQCLMLIAMGLPQFPPPRDAPVTPPQPVEPFKVISNIYFVGPESEHSSFLITTPQGHILINTGFERQVPIPLEYRGIRLEAGYRLDILVAGRVVVEVKAMDAIAPIHEAQLLTYLCLAVGKSGC